MYPPQSEIQNCSVKIAAKIAQDAYDENTASTYPEPKDKIEFIKWVSLHIDLEFNDNNLVSFSGANCTTLNTMESALFQRDTTGPKRFKNISASSN